MICTTLRAVMIYHCFAMDKKICRHKSTDFLVDPKGIEPSNLTDANRALSQLSYGPKYAPYLNAKAARCQGVL